MTALILAQDRIPDRLNDDVERILTGKKPLDGRLTVTASAAGRPSSSSPAGRSRRVMSRTSACR